jgi:hypothetical protein
MTYRIKALTLGFIIGITVLFAGTALLADEMDNCQDFADRYVAPVTDARDVGTPPEVIFQQLVMTGFPQEGAFNLVQTIYVLHKDSNKEEVLASFMNWCVGESA